VKLKFAWLAKPTMGEIRAIKYMYIDFHKGQYFRVAHKFPR